MEKWSFQRIRELMTPIALRGMAGNKIGCARISMMVRSISSNTRPDTLMQDRTLQAYRFLLQRTAGPYIGVIHAMEGGYHASIARARSPPSGTGNTLANRWRGVVDFLRTRPPSGRGGATILQHGENSMAG